MNFKESNNCLKKTIKNHMVFHVFGTRDLQRDPQESQEPHKKHLESCKDPTKNQPKKNKINASVVKNALSRRSQKIEIRAPILIQLSAHF